MPILNRITALSLLFPAAILAGEAWLIATVADRAFDLGALISWALPSEQGASGPETVLVPIHELNYRLSGVYVIDGKEVDAGTERRLIEAQLQITRDQVTEVEYAECVQANICKSASSRWRPISGPRPVTGISYVDATQYAEWLSDRTGQVWRLPTDEEWVFAAGSRARDDAVGTDSRSDNPAARWLDAYAQQNEARDAAGPPQPTGFFGSNEYGLNDLSGNVWEWTDTCFSRTRMSREGEVLSVLDTCAVRVVQGLHRTYVSTFIRDAKAGGCSVGAPPNHLGFRLVREPPTGPLEHLMGWFSRGIDKSLMPV